MSARVTRKRARTESEETSKQESEEVDTTTSTCDRDPQPPDLGDEHENLERDAEFWISDGTVILVAKDVEFRFYRALLADHSPVFKAMFAGQHPSRLVPIDEQQSITCPVVQLTDSPQDLRHILRAYLSGTESGFLEAAEPSFDEISAYIRLGHKYELETLYEHSLEFLKHHYTGDFKTSVGIVNLARLGLLNEPSLLPTALLTCVYMKEDIMQGFEREDGSRETLTLDDIGRCFKASGAIRQATVASVVRTLRDKVFSTCGTQASCLAALRRVLQGLDKVTWLLTSCPIRLAPDNLLDHKEKLGACTACTAMVRRRNRKERAALWARLPDLLDVEVSGWPGGEDGAPQDEAS
ncbi:hypothetical protein LXA43DRAFT_992550 [Ganoderma leucocontextum]|nr:hypothetical protein LXA43DRAFT_992550 [Ganoderma leucocontextum]